MYILMRSSHVSETSNFILVFALKLISTEQILKYIQFSVKMLPKVLPCQHFHIYFNLSERFFYPTVFHTIFMPSVPKLLFSTNVLIIKTYKKVYLNCLTSAQVSMKTVNIILSLYNINNTLEGKKNTKSLTKCVEKLACLYLHLNRK